MLELDTKRKERLIDLLLLLAISSFLSMITAVYSFISKANIIQYTNIDFAVRIYYSLLSIGVFFYILKKQNRNISEFGISFKVKDILHSILLIIAIFVSYVIVGLLLRIFLGNINTSSSNFNLIKVNSIWIILYILIKPWVEELILKGFLITEIEFLTKNIYIAVFTSVFIQSVANIFQGGISVLYLASILLILSIYFAKTRRIAPVILAHYLFEFIPMISKL